MKLNTKMKIDNAALVGAGLGLILAMPVLAETDLPGQGPGPEGTLDKSEQIQQSYGEGQGGTSGYGTQAFEKLDRNNDSYVTKDEVQDHSKLKQRWSTVDQNSDNKLDKGEFAAFEASSRMGGTETGGMFGPGVHPQSTPGD